MRFANPRQAAAGGVGVVHQERNLVTRFSVAENIMLDKLGAHSLSAVDYKSLAEEARRWLKQLDLDIDPATPVARLSVAQMQLVEIGKALSLQSRVLLLDEPTASLTPSEAQVLFRLLRKLRDEGVAIGFVSHKLEEVFDICDTVTVLRDGKNACDSADLSSTEPRRRGEDDDRTRRAHFAPRAAFDARASAVLRIERLFLRGRAREGHAFRTAGRNPRLVRPRWRRAQRTGKGGSGTVDADRRRSSRRRQACQDRLRCRGAAI